jgi:hypothetical protein
MKSVLVTDTSKGMGFETGLAFWPPHVPSMVVL